MSDLERWVLPSTLEWLREGDAKRAAIQAEIDDDEAGYANFLFSQEEKLRGLENERGEQEPAAGREVFRWSSSRSNPDGFSGPLSAPRSKEDGAINTIYVLNGESLAGFGDQVWASSRHISQCLADASVCCKILGKDADASSSELRSFDASTPDIIDTRCEAPSGATSGVSKSNAMGSAPGAADSALTTSRLSAVPMPFTPTKRTSRTAAGGPAS